MKLYNYSINLENKTDQEINRYLRSELRNREGYSWQYWPFWIGLAWGALIVASMDYGDVHFCVGGCDDKSAWRATVNE